MDAATPRGNYVGVPGPANTLPPELVGTVIEDGGGGNILGIQATARSALAKVFLDPTRQRLIHHVSPPTDITANCANTSQVTLVDTLKAAT